MKVKGNEQSTENDARQKKKKKVILAGVSFFNVAHILGFSTIH
jgi:hypothetical protein